MALCRRCAVVLYGIISAPQPRPQSPKPGSLGVLPLWIACTLHSYCDWVMTAFSPAGGNDPLGLLWVYKQGLLPALLRGLSKVVKGSVVGGSGCQPSCLQFVSALAAGTPKGRACSLCSQPRSLAAGTVGTVVCGLISPFLRAGVTLKWYWSHIGLPTRWVGQDLKQPGWIGQVPREHRGWASVLKQNRWWMLALILTSHQLSRLEEGKRNGICQHCCSCRNLLPIPVL